MAKTYNFTASFSSNVWINGGGLFNEPLSVHLSVDGSSDIAIEVYDYYRNKVGTMNTGSFSGAVNFPIDHLTASGKSYRIKLVNRRYLSQVNITFGQLYYT